MVMKFYRCKENPVDCVSYKASVPGSLMLFGEHAVLHNKQAIALALNHYIKVNLVPCSDNNIRITSSMFADHKVALDKFKITKPYDYVLIAIKQYFKKIKCGFALNIYSDFSADIGFGSSAAVTVATLKVLSLWLDQKPIGKMKLYQQAVKVVRLVQGFGSGADVVACVFGGVLAYKMQPISIKKIANNLPLVAVYSGRKLATKKVVVKVRQSRKRFPKVFSELYNAIDSCSKEAIKAIKNKNYSRLGELMNIHQGLQDALGVNNKILSELIFSLRAKKTIYGAKISGSGLGDCVIALGKINKNTFPENDRQKKM